ncbi:hypothetical protein Pyn_05431 [Prunus yedoensis var. nudiflora]|uniref:Uncharacterized protein n=1 Tax=Prunus yedoensis var. nudiflora TaxID=2094558 RepID=A0A314Y955_PRUYE|nr:hypothetical protein Pyn_05431 [Prunus yedoensis var. nudiflora]
MASGSENPKALEDNQPKMDPKVRIMPNYCKHGAVHDRTCGHMQESIRKWCQDCYNDKLILHWEERGRFKSIDESDAEY